LPLEQSELPGGQQQVLECLDGFVVIQESLNIQSAFVAFMNKVPLALLPLCRAAQVQSEHLFDLEAACENQFGPKASRTCSWENFVDRLAFCF